jgi:hypothetical protein
VQRQGWEAKLRDALADIEDGERGGHASDVLELGPSSVRLTADDGTFG